MDYKDLVVLSEEQVLKQFDTPLQGLSENAVTQRLLKYGPNTFKDKHHHSLLYFLLESLKDEFILVFTAFGCCFLCAQRSFGGLYYYRACHD